MGAAHSQHDLTPMFPWPKERTDRIDQVVEANRNNPKFVRFWETRIEIEDPVDMQVQQWGETIKLRSYHQPTKVDRKSADFKGVVFFVHGFTDHGGRYGHLATKFADLGYDFFMMDARGHGGSEGAQILIQSVDQAIDDNFSFHRKVIDQVYSKEKGFERPPPCFLLCHSFGGMQVLNGLLRDRHLDDGVSRYKGVFFACPFWGYFNQPTMDRLYYAVKLLVTARGDYGFLPEQPEEESNHEEHVLHWVIDKRNRHQRRFIPAQTCLSFSDEIYKLQTLANGPKEELEAKCANLPPMFLFNGGNDIIVSAKMAEDLFKKLPSKQAKKFHEEAGMNHDPQANGLFVDTYVKMISDFFQETCN